LVQLSRLDWAAALGMGSVTPVLVWTTKGDMPPVPRPRRRAQSRPRPSGISTVPGRNVATATMRECLRVLLGVSEGAHRADPERHHPGAANIALVVTYG